MAKSTKKRGNSSNVGANKSPEEIIQSIGTLLDKLETGHILAELAPDAIEGRKCVYLLFPELKHKKIKAPNSLLKILSTVESKDTANKNLQKAKKDGIMGKAKKEFEDMKNALIGENGKSVTSPKQEDPTTPVDWSETEKDKSKETKGTKAGAKEQGKLTEFSVNSNQGTELKDTNKAAAAQPSSTFPEGANSTVGSQQQQTQASTSQVTAGGQTKQIAPAEKSEADKQPDENLRTENTSGNNKSLEEEKIQQLQAEIKSLKTRLSEVAGKKLIAGNANIADLGDPNRPIKLADEFSELYDNVWSDAYETLIKQKEKEETIPKYLLRIIKVVDQFCKESKQNQLSLLCNIFRTPMIFPTLSVDAALKKKPAKTDKDVVLDAAHPILQAAQRAACQVSLDELKKEFHSKKTKEITPKFAKLEPVACYVNRCVELLWLMCMKDPPMYLAGFKDDELSPANFREYMEKGKSAVSCVWPALFLFEGGPLMKKGVAVFE